MCMTPSIASVEQCSADAPLARKLCPQTLLVLQLLPLTANNLTALTTTATIAATSTNTANALLFASGCGVIFNTSNATATTMTDTVRTASRGLLRLLVQQQRLMLLFLLHLPNQYYHHLCCYYV